MATQDMNSLIAQATDYPRNVQCRFFYGIVLHEYFEQLDKLGAQLFHNAGRAQLDFWECLNGQSGKAFAEACDI